MAYESFESFSINKVVLLMRYISHACFVSGTYVCYASNRLGTAVTNTAVLREATLNEFEKKDIQVVTVKEGNPLDIKCNMPGGWPTPTIQWMIVVRGIIASQLGFCLFDLMFL